MEQERSEPETGDPRIVEEVFARRDSARGHRWFVAVLAAFGVYALVFVAVPFFAAHSLQEWASDLAARVHAELDREREVTLEPAPPPPPPPAREAPTPPPAEIKAPPKLATARPKSAPPPAPAQAAAVVARATPADPLDLTATTFVTGRSATYAGGTTTATGTNTHAVESAVVDPRGPRTASRARSIRLDEADWSCPWPREADSADINEQVVLLRVAVQADGAVQAAKILSDPGFGFGQAARACALRTHFEPAQDDAGNSIFAWSPPIRVRFIR